MSEFENAVLYRFKECIEAYFDNCNVAYIAQKDPDKTIVDYFAWLYRQIPQIKRVVTYSSELIKKIEDGEIPKPYLEYLEYFKSRFEEGEDMTGFLSKFVYDAEKTDRFRYTWHIFHLHLSANIAKNKEEMRVNRSGQLLLAVITEKEVLFVDIIKHPNKGQSREFFDIEHLRIIKNNGWLEKIGFYRIEGAYQDDESLKIVSYDQICDLYVAGVNIGFELDDGIYLPVDPIMMNGMPYAAIDTHNRIIRNLRHLNKSCKDCKDVNLSSYHNGRLAVVVSAISNDDKQIDFDILNNVLI